MRRRLLAVLLLLPVPAAAHSFGYTDVHMQLGADGRYAVDVTCDLDALALGVSSTTDSAKLAAEIEALPEAERAELVEQLKALLQRRLRVRFDGQPDSFGVELPESGEPPRAGQLPTALGLRARLVGRIPQGARTVSFFASRAFPPVRLIVTRPGEAPGAPDLLPQGGESGPIALTGPQAAPGRLERFRRFVALGVEHIVPLGLDHILFVLGLVLLGKHLAPLLAQVTAFTLAHTLTLFLSSYGVVRLSPRVVEPLIALSIAYVAIENVVSPRLRRSRLALVFGFGLLHGLGFAGVLAELGLPEARRVVALFGFNVGVELGQLSVIAAALAALALVTRLGAPRATLARAVSLLIAVVGLVWTVQRVVAP